MSENGNQGRSAGELVRQLSEHLSTLIRSEIALAKLEVKETFTSLGAGGILLAGAAVCALCAVVFIVVTVVLALALIIPAWASTLIVAVGLLLIAAGLAFAGRKKLQNIELMPSTTIENVKADVQVIRSDLQRLKEKRSHG